MKHHIICMKLSKTVILIAMIIIIQLGFIVSQLIRLQEENSFRQIQESVEKTKSTKQLPELNIKEEVKQNTLVEYANMPKEIKGYQVIGKIEIPSIQLENYILSQTNTKALKVAVTKLTGPNINEVGNFCIAGHNYKNMKMFGAIKKLQVGDSIILTDTYDRSVTYKVYQTYQTNPKDVSCLEQETLGERELTLITCTTGAIKRVIVKAVEDYD